AVYSRGRDGRGLSGAFTFRAGLPVGVLFAVTRCARFWLKPVGPVQLDRLQVDRPQGASKRRLEMILDDTLPAYARLLPESVFDSLPPDIIGEFGERDSCFLLLHQSQEFLFRDLVECVV